MVLNPGKEKIRKVILLQSGIALIVSLFFYLIMGGKSGLSAFAGGSICVVTHLLFAMKFFAHSGARQAQAIIKAFYYGEAMKLVLTALLFAGVFYWGEVAALPLFTGFIVTQFGNWLALIVL